MAEKKEDFVVSDRRRFGTEGELRTDVPEHEEDKTQTAAAPVSAAAAAPVEQAGAAPPSVAEHAPAATSPSTPSETEAQGEEEMPEPPSPGEVQEQKDAYHASGRKIDDLIGKSGGRAATMPEMTFERLIESFYMTALLQLGAIRQEGETPGVDIMGARQTIDSLTILQEKTKGNLTDREQTLLQNVLFELRMAWIEITNALASAKPGPGPGAMHEKK
jgi:hypothetical protein